MARPKKFNDTPTQSVAFRMPRPDVEAIDRIAKELSQRHGIHVSRTDAFLRLVTLGRDALRATMPDEAA